MKWWVKGLPDKNWNGVKWRDMDTNHLRNTAAWLKRRCAERSAKYLRENPFGDGWEVDRKNWVDEVMADEMNHYANWRDKTGKLDP